MWRIAERTRPNAGVSVQQMMLAIQERNPDAFIKNNVNLVREGAVLRLPTESQVRELSSREALSRVAVQNREWQRLRAERAPAPSRAPVDATGRRQADSDGASADGDGRVTLVTPDSAAGVGDGDGTGAAGGSANTAALQNELAIRDENLDRLQRENDELRSRIGDLDGQVEISQRLLELRNEKIAALQEELRRLSEQQGAEVDPQLLEQPATPMPVEPDGGIGDGAVGPNGEGADGSAGEGAEDATGQPPASEQAAAPQEAQPDTQADTRNNDAVNPPPRPQPATPASDTGGGIVDLIMENLLYIGAALAVLLLLILLAVRRRQGGDKNADEDSGSDDDNGGFDAAPVMAAEDHGQDSEDHGEVPQEDLEDEHMDPMERADVYVAYGQYPQAVDYLRNEINQAPERGDLKIRLLELLREMDDDSGFHRQAAVFAGSSTAVDAAIKRLGGDPGDADEYAAIADDPEEDGPQEEEELSLDDLELDLASDLSDGGFDDGLLGASGEREEDDQDGLELDDLDFNLDDDDDQPAAGGTEASSLETAGLETGSLDTESLDSESLEIDGAESDGDDEQTLEFDDLVLDEPDSDGESGAGEEDDGAFEFSLDDDEEEGAAGTTFTEEELAALELADERGRESDADAAADIGDLDLDDLELDDLDVDDLDLELDDAPRQDSLAADSPLTNTPVSDAPANRTSEGTRADLDDLDLSLDDLYLSEENAPDDRAADSAPADTDADAEELADPQDIADLEDTAEPQELAASEEELDDLDLDFDDAELEPTPVAATPAGSDKADDMLGDDDDFDFLSETDENATKLDLARAYIDMGDAEGARDILNEVLSEGSEEQQGEAKELLARVS